MPNAKVAGVVVNPLDVLGPALRDAIEQIVADEVERRLAEIDARPAEQPSPYLSVEEAAAYLRCSRQRVYDLLSARRLTRIKDGSRTLLARSEVEEYLNGRRTK